MAQFNVTFEIVTPESAIDGDCEERGYISQCQPLREALADLWETRTSQVDGVQFIEANNSDARDAEWVTVYNGMEYVTGANESRSIHFPKHLTPASRARLVAAIQNGLSA